MPGPVQIDRVRNRDFELMYERQRSPDPAILDQVWNSKWDQPGGWAWTGFKDDKLDEALYKLRSLPSIRGALRGSQGGPEDHHGKRPDAADAQRPGFVAFPRKVKGFKMGSEGNWFFLNDASFEK